MSNSSASGARRVRDALLFAAALFAVLLRPRPVLVLRLALLPREDDVVLRAVPRSDDDLALERLVPFAADCDVDLAEVLVADFVVRRWVGMIVSFSSIEFATQVRMAPG